MTTQTDTLLGRDGCSSDEIRSEYLLRDGKLIERCTYDRSEREVSPADAVAELERAVANGRYMADLCRAQKIPTRDYDERARNAATAAAAIRATFGI